MFDSFCYGFFFFFKQKTAYEMRISDWSSDVCSSDLDGPIRVARKERRDLVFALGAFERAGGIDQCAARFDPACRAREQIGLPGGHFGDLPRFEALETSGVAADDATRPPRRISPARSRRRAGFTRAGKRPDPHPRE